MGNVAQLQGTPWHPEQMHKSCTDGSRYCLYNKDNVCMCTASIYYKKGCVGKGDCDEFESKGNIAKSVTEKTIIIKQNPRNSKNNYRDETSSLKTVKIKLNNQKKDDNNMNNIEENIIDCDDEKDTLSLNETPEEKFKRVSKKRIENVISDLKLISNMAGKSYYAYTDKQIQKVFEHIDKAVQKAKESYMEKKVY